MIIRFCSHEHEPQLLWTNWGCRQSFHAALNVMLWHFCFVLVYMGNVLNLLAIHVADYQWFFSRYTCHCLYLVHINWYRLDMSCYWVNLCVVSVSSEGFGYNNKSCKDRGIHIGAYIMEKRWQNIYIVSLGLYRLMQVSVISNYFCYYLSTVCILENLHMFYIRYYLLLW